MSRRKIVVEGTVFHWETNGRSLKIIPPKKQGSSRKYALPTGGDRWYDDWTFVVTPSYVAERIYADFLGRPMPIRQPSPTKVVRSPQRREPAPRWGTCPEFPRTYLIQARVRIPDEGARTLPLEMHGDPETAKAAVSFFGGSAVRQLLGAPGPVGRVRCGDDGAGETVARLKDWLDSFSDRKAIALLEFDTVELPLKLAMPKAA